MGAETLVLAPVVVWVYNDLDHYPSEILAHFMGPVSPYPLNLEGRALLHPLNLGAEGPKPLVLQCFLTPFLWGGVAHRLMFLVRWAQPPIVPEMLSW